jgi:hypothetical protein
MRILLLAVVIALLVALSAAPAFAAANPNGTGQPSQECGSGTAPNGPSGFDTGGFSNAESHYAGSPGTPSAAHGSGKAVSQYDVACFQTSQH